MILSPFLILLSLPNSQKRWAEALLTEGASWRKMHVNIIDSVSGHEPVTNMVNKTCSNIKVKLGYCY